LHASILSGAYPFSLFEMERFSILLKAQRDSVRCQRDAFQSRAAQDSRTVIILNPFQRHKGLAEVSADAATLQRIFDPLKFARRRVSRAAPLDYLAVCVAVESDTEWNFNLCSKPISQVISMLSGCLFPDGVGSFPNSLSVPIRHGSSS
jgi:hypothetical protein